MPIYAYKCSACGHEQDVLQKMSDSRLTVCPQCGQSTYVKQVTAAGFQLKGSGWYVTDFRGNGSKPSADHAHASNGHGSSASGAPDAAAAPASSHDGSSANGTNGSHSSTADSSSPSGTEHKTASPKTPAASPAPSPSAAEPKH